MKQRAADRAGTAPRGDPPRCLAPAARQPDELRRRGSQQEGRDEEQQRRAGQHFRVQVPGTELTPQRLRTRNDCGRYQHHHQRKRGGDETAGESRGGIDSRPTRGTVGEPTPDRVARRGRRQQHTNHPAPCGERAAEITRGQSCGYQFEREQTETGQKRDHRRTTRGQPGRRGWFRSPRPGASLAQRGDSHGTNHEECRAAEQNRIQRQRRDQHEPRKPDACECAKRAERECRAGRTTAGTTAIGQSLHHQRRGDRQRQRGGECGQNRQNRCPGGQSGSCERCRAIPGSARPRRRRGTRMLPASGAVPRPIGRRGQVARRGLSRARNQRDSRR